MRISVLTPTIRAHRLKPVYDSLKRQTFSDFEWLVEFGFDGSRFTLPEDMNKMLRRATGELVVVWQDSIAVDDADFLATVAKLHADGRKLGVTYPVGKIQDQAKCPVGANVQWDWRVYRNGRINANQWETDLASCPVSLFRDVGGYDEAYCAGWSCDNVEVALRAEAAGYQFECYSLARGVADDHDALEPHPFRQKLPFNGPRMNQTQREASGGKYKLDYL